MVHAMNTPEDEPREEPLPETDSASEAGAASPVSSEGIPLAVPVGTGPETPAMPLESPPEHMEPPVAPLLCPACQSPRASGQSYCDSCGYFFPPDLPAGTFAAPAAQAVAGTRVGGRYELAALINERLGVSRFRALDHGAGTPAPVPVIVVRMASPPAELLPVAQEVAAPPVDDEVLPSFDEPLPPVAATPVQTDTLSSTAPDYNAWPSVHWECELLKVVAHPPCRRYSIASVKMAMITWSRNCHRDGCSGTPGTIPIPTRACASAG
jgi:hypothetical protein